jgi:hypothetical protein
MFFLAMKDSKPQERPGKPETSEEAKCLMCGLKSESPTIAAFWNQHPDCQRWNGQMPEGVRLLVSRDKDAKEADASKLVPFRQFGAFYVAFNPFENSAFADQRIVPGAADHDQP